MNNPAFTFIILTFNEAKHLPRLLDSIKELNAPIYVLDSGSTDETLTICNLAGITVRYNNFENHPKQWNHALSRFKVNTPWVIGLDADQIVSSELKQMLANFKDKNYSHIEGIYFNRKNYFKGKWIKHGGYYPKYLLKMFRSDKGYSDLTENMDHRFQVPGKTLIWKQGYLIEENLKENEISFWIEKHNRYSDLLAIEEVERIYQLRQPALKIKPFGSPNERNAWLKKYWWKMPKYLRPFLYLVYRLIIRRGFLDGKTGLIYHFLQAFWFRLLVDIKIDEYLNHTTKPKPSTSKFLLKFMILFFILYGFNIIYIGITTPGGLYIKWLDQYLNFISWWRQFSISSTAAMLTMLNYTIQINDYGLSVKDHSGFKLVYSCLGYGIMSGFASFVIAFPTSRYSKIYFLVTGLLGIQILNTIRLVLIAIYYDHSNKFFGLDPHNLFNLFIYALLAGAIYRWASSRNN